MGPIFPDARHGNYPFPPPQQMSDSDSQPWLIPHATDILWSPVQTCSLEHLPPTPLILTSSGTHPTEMLCCLFQVCVLDRSFGVHWGVTGGYVLESMRTCLHSGGGKFTTAVLISLLPLTSPHVTRDSLVLLHFHNVVFGENWYHGVAKFVAGWVAKMFLGWGGKTAIWIGWQNFTQEVRWLGTKCEILHSLIKSIQDNGYT